jgi:hypothetical protein
VTTDTDQPPPSADRPIERLADDRLSRGGFAELIATQAIAARPEDGFVLAITGQWGAGKTSVLRLVEEQIEGKVLIVRFNPWLYGPGDDLVRRFLTELSNQLPGDGLSTLRARLRGYAEVLTPLTGLAGASMQIVSRALDTSVEDDREAIARLLVDLDKRVVVVLDDLDRLEPKEVADMVRLVKLVGDFPNTTYLLAYDRVQVEQALEGAHGGSGRDYLDKIVQASFPLPHIEGSELAGLLTRDLESRLSPEATRALGDRWPTILSSVITPLLRTVRDVRRVANVATATAHLTGDDVALEDVLALEAIRVLLPDVYDALPAAARALTRMPRGGLFAEREEQEAKRVQQLTDKRPDVARALIRQLFPAAERHVGGNTYDGAFIREWRRDRRVATYAGLMTYLTKAVGEHAVRAAKVRAVLDSLGDTDAFSEAIRDVPTDQLPDLLARLGDHMDETPVSPATAGAAVPNLMNLIAKLPSQTRTSLDVEAEFLVRPLAESLLSRVAQTERYAIAGETLAGIASLYAKFRFVQWFGDHGEADQGDAEPLFAEAMTYRLRNDVKAALLIADPESLREERQMALVIGLLVREGGEEGTRRLAELVADDEFLLTMLVAFARRQIDTDLEGTYETPRGVTLDWESLTRLVDAQLLRRRVLELREALGRELGQDEEAVMALAEQHASAAG